MIRRRKRKLSRKQRRIKSKVTIRTLLLLIITLIFNTYAWFIYITTVSTNLTAHVDAWKVEFTDIDGTLKKEVEFEVEHAYPGMKDKIKQIGILNGGDKAAEITFDVVSLKIFDETYVSRESLNDGETAEEGIVILSSQEIKSKIEDDYPFHIKVEMNKALINPGERTQMNITFKWEYETGKDENDTAYGTRAYEYYEKNPSESAIQIVIKVSAVQHKEE